MFFYIVLSFTFLAHSGETSDRCLHYVSGRCYWMVWDYQKLSFADAHERCQAEDGILAEIPDQEAQTQIKRWLVSSLYQNSRIWIGVNDINEEGNFVNMLNETVNITNWATGEPKNNVEIYQKIYKCDCVRIVLGTGLGYYATPCSFYYVYALCSQRYDIEQIQTQSSSLPVPYTSVHTTTLSTTTTTTTTTDLSTKYQTSEKNTDHLTTKNHITVSQTSEQITSKSTTTDRTSEFKTDEEFATQSTTTYQSKVSQTSDQTTTQSSTQLTTMDHTTIMQTSAQTFTKPVTTDSPSILQTSMQTFSNVQSTIGTTLHVNQQRECMCPCSRMKNLVIIKNKTELLTKIDKMKKELAVKKSSLSSSVRKKTSAVDPRPSASIVGGTISVVIIATVVGLIVLIDLTRLINFWWKTIQKRCNRKTRAAQKGKV